MTTEEACGRVRRVELWAVGLTVAASLVVLPAALNRFVFPKLAVVALALLVATWAPARGRLPRVAWILLAAAAALMLVGVAAADTPAVQALGRAPRYEGFVVVVIYLAALVMGARMLGPARAPGISGWLLRCLAVAALIAATVALLQAAGARILPGTSERPGGLLGNASDSGVLAVLLLAPLAAVAVRVRGPLYVAGAVAAAVLLACSGSRGAVLAAGVAAAVIIALMPDRRPRLAVASGFLAALALTLLMPATRSRVIGSDALAEATVDGRRALWSAAAELLADRPLSGVGVGGFGFAVPAHQDLAAATEIGTLQLPDSPHNWVLQAGAAGGVLLIAIALALAAVTLARGYRALPGQLTGGERALTIGLLAAVAGYATALLFHFTSPGTTPLAALFAGALLASAPSPRGDGRGRAPRTALRWVVRVALAVTLLVLLAGAAAEIPLSRAIDAAAQRDVAKADHSFEVARDLRPWDVAVPTTAAHAYATLADLGAREAIPLGERWSSTALSREPRSPRALADAARLALANREPQRARSLLDRAHPGYRFDGELVLLRGELALSEARAGAARSAFLLATRLNPDDPRGWRGLSVALSAAGLPDAAAAERRARQLEG